ncbi:MAG: molybdopterin-guanine dinucleotide biosynthesis protein A [Geminicoccaceae bacterium]
MRMALRRLILASVLGLCIIPLASAQNGDGSSDRHEGYYYPPPTTKEVYQARAQILPQASRERRVAFVVEMTQGLLSRPHAPDFAVFVKGAHAEKLIIVALRDDVIDTLYRARALLAQLTSVARNTPLFKEFGVEDYFTFFDLLRMQGFERMTVSDGDDFAHQVDFK